jgi:small subunit ribosomal protein S2
MAKKKDSADDTKKKSRQKDDKKNNKVAEKKEESSKKKATKTKTSEKKSQKKKKKSKKKTKKAKKRSSKEKEKVKKQEEETSKQTKVKKEAEDKYKVDLEELLEAGCHFGHQARRWHPNMKKYIWKEREGIHIFDLLKTQKELQKVCLQAQKMAEEGKKILFVGTKRQARDVIREEIEKVGMPWVAVRWIGGTLTNWKQIQKSIDKLKEMKKKKEAGEYDMYTKKENILIDREIRRLEYLFGGIKELEQPPEALFIVDTKREDTAVREAQLEGLKTFAILDSNADPTDIDYVVPANDDAIRSIKLIISEVVSAIEEGKQIRKKKQAKKGKGKSKKTKQKRGKSKKSKKKKGEKKNG